MNLRCDWCNRTDVKKLRVIDASGCAIYLCEQCYNTHQKIRDAGVIKVYA